MRLPSLPLFCVLLLAGSGTTRAAEVLAKINDAAGKPVADAVISLTPLDAPLPPPAEAPITGVEIAQIGEEYRPYVTPVLVNTRIDFPNKDQVQHHIYSVSKTKPFEKPLYESGASESVLFDRPGVATLGCNIHDWMAAYVVVLETPFFAKSSAQGEALVENLPAGRHTLTVWHPRLATPLTREILVSDDAAQTETIQLKLRPDRRLRRAPVGESKTY